ncbi:unnamed protein product [Arctogadus glacialis]
MFDGAFWRQNYYKWKHSNLTRKHCNLTLKHCSLILNHFILTRKQCILTLNQFILTLKHCILNLNHFILTRKHCILTLKHCILNLNHFNLTLKHCILTLENFNSKPKQSSPDRCHTNHCSHSHHSVCFLTLVFLSLGPPPPMCNYSGEADKTGFLFTFEDVTEGNYSIKLTELSTGVSNKVTNEVPLNGTNATHLLQYLKPSTDYRVHISPSNEPKVTCGGNLELKTNGINQDEIVELPTDSYQDICYKTEWNINNAVFDVSRKDYTFCIKPKYTDLCTNLTTLIYPTLTLTKWIGLEYLNPDNIKLEVPNKLPAEINWRNQEDLKCEGLGINFTCQGPDRREYKLDKLEPYTKYSCTGVLYNLNKTIAIEKKVTKEVEITCVLLVGTQESLHGSQGVEVENVIFAIIFAFVTLSNAHCEGTVEF